MNKLLITAALGLVFALGANAADNKPQSRLATCSQEAGQRQDRERKAFIKNCLSAKRETPPQTKLASCNAQAKGLKGFARERAMSICMEK